MYLIFTIFCRVTGIIIQFILMKTSTFQHFTDTEAQWTEIAIASGNENLTGATIHFEYVVE